MMRQNRQSFVGVQSGEDSGLKNLDSDATATRAGSIRFSLRTLRCLCVLCGSKALNRKRTQSLPQGSQRNRRESTRQSRDICRNPGSPKKSPGEKEKNFS